jgi:hypothetical protein
VAVRVWAKLAVALGGRTSKTREEEGMGGDYNGGGVKRRERSVCPRQRRVSGKMMGWDDDGDCTGHRGPNA